ncbi:MAG: cytochrome c [Chloroflexi bacterium]|nr:cytochrome c [Chloroflexota bacterium]
MIRRILTTLAILAAPLTVGLLLTYEVIAVDLTLFMEDQISLRPQEGPRWAAPPEAVPFGRPAYLDAPATTVNPVSADEVSLQRGAVLYDLHCRACHGAGAGDGPVTAFWGEGARRPANLTEARFRGYPDATFRLVVSNGIGAMPPLRENLDERQRWDAINHVRTLQPN